MPNNILKRQSLYCKEHHIICIDDDPYFLKSMNYVLSELINHKIKDGIYYHCTCLEDPVEALKLIKNLVDNQETIALVICDQKMPQMKGIELLGKVKRMTPTVSTVLLTGYAGIDSAIEAINNKLLDKYLTKPIEDEKDFIITIQHLLQTFTMNQTINEQNKIIYELFDFSNELNRINNFQEALDCIVTHTKELLHCERVTLMLLDKKKSCLKIAASCGIPVNDLYVNEVQIHPNLIEAFNTNRRAIEAKSLSDISYLPHGIEKDEVPFIHLPTAYIKLASGDEPLGVLNISQKIHGDPFDSIDFANLIYIASTASIAIHNHINLLKLNDAYFEVKNKAITLEHQLVHDQLTGMPNRIKLIEYIKQQIEERNDDQKRISLILMNIKNFREINDTLGHHNGDVLLKKVATRLDENLDKSEMLARIGADLFVYLITDIKPIEVEAYIEQINQALKAPFCLEGINIEINMNFGLANYPEHGANANLLLQKAEIAMHAGKQSHSEINIYTPDNDGYDARRLSLISELRIAIENGELSLFYQPKYNINKGVYDSAEALIRWHHPTNGLMMPDQFIPIAEQAGFMKPLTDWVITEAIRQISEWSESKPFDHDINVAVNLSPTNLLEPQLPDNIRKLLDKYAVEPSRLELEVTERSVMANPEIAIHILQKLSEIGLKITIDDYGTGHSSLSYIKLLPLNYLKIDRIFVKNILFDTRDMHIVKSTIELGHHLDIEVIAEGVENLKTLELLKSLGCDSIQGYVLSKPVPALDFVEWMKKQKDKDFDLGSTSKADE